MRKICVALSKGGVAKSTTAVHIASGLAATGKKVLLVDTDDQGKVDFLLGVTPRWGISDLILNNIQSIFNGAEYITENFDILSKGAHLSSAKREIGNKALGGHKVLSDILRQIEHLYDYVIVDTSPSIDCLTYNVLFYCIEVLIPVSLEPMSLGSLAEFVKVIESVKEYNPDLKHKYVVPTFHDGRVSKSDIILKQLQEHFPSQICDPIRYCVKISEASSVGKTIFEFAPKCQGAKDYQTLVQRILADE